jgi:predicted nucleic acid-binding protein
LGAYFNRNRSFMSNLQSMLPDRRIFWTSAISLGEVEAGYRITPNHDGNVEVEFRKWLTKEFLQKPSGVNFVLPVDEGIRTFYGDIIGRICAQHPGRNMKERTEAFLNSHGADINDVWIVATAWAYNLTLLTNDSMTVIRSVVTPSEVNILDWL